MKKIMLLIAFVLVVAVIVFVWYMGVFQSIVIEEQDQGPFTLVYQEMTGNDMKQVGEITTKLDKLLTEHGITHRKPLDVFFPDNKAEIGFAVENSSPSQLIALGEQTKVREIPVQRYMVSHFPCHNKMSFIVGYMKVEPALKKYRSEHNNKTVEAYALNNGDTIDYMQPVVKKK
jgi:multidrug efflux pump subunit AcrB